MDFSQLTAQDRHETGSWLHLPHPATGLPLYLAEGNTITTEETDKPCEVLVLGNRAPRVKACLDARARAEELHAMRLLRASESDQAGLMSQNAKAREAHLRDLLIATVMDWRNIVIKEGEAPVECTTANVLTALNHPSFMTVIFKRASDEGALFTSAPTG